MIIKDLQNVEDLAGMIENEGLDYFFMEHLSPESIKDHELGANVDAWRTYRAAAIARLRDLGVEVE